MAKSFESFCQLLSWINAKIAERECEPKSVGPRRPPTRKRAPPELELELEALERAGKIKPIGKIEITLPKRLTPDDVYSRVNPDGGGSVLGVDLQGISFMETDSLRAGHQFCEQEIVARGEVCPEWVKPYPHHPVTNVLQIIEYLDGSTRDLFRESKRSGSDTAEARRILGNSKLTLRQLIRRGELEHGLPKWLSDEPRSKASAQQQIYDLLQWLYGVARGKSGTHISHEAESNKVCGSGASASRSGKTSQKEADQILRKRLLENPELRSARIDKWAEAVREENGKSCSTSTVSKTKSWQTAMAASGRGRPSKKSTNSSASNVLVNLIADEDEISAKTAIELSDLSSRRKAGLISDLETGTQTPASILKIVIDKSKLPTRQKADLLLGLERGTRSFTGILEILQKCSES
jgi:hypothetical protein